MTTPDYSSENEVNINNRLFRLARNNIEKNTPPIKSLEDDDKEKAEKNLIYYGSEFINNLKQINYTFTQIDDYILKKAKIPILISDDISSNLQKFTVAKLRDFIKNSGLRIPYMGLKKDELISTIIENDIKVSDDYKFPTELTYKGFLEFQAEKNTKEALEAPEASEASEVPESPDWLQFEPLLRYPPLDRYLEYSQEELTNARKKLGVEMKRIDKLITDESRRLNITEESQSTPEINKMIEYFKFLENEFDFIESKKNTGAGRYRGGAKKKKGSTPSERTRPYLSRKSKNTDPDYIFQAKEASKLLSGLLLGDSGGVEESKEEGPLQETKDELDYIEEPAPEATAKSNKKESVKLDEALTEAVISNTESKQKSEIPTNLSKIYDLLTELIRFIGRTTSLYISKIKMNLNYLDEDQIKLIFDNTQLLKNNLTTISRFQDKGTAPIKDTLYKQLEKETKGLYNEVNDSIRNIKKLKNYNVFEGAGMNHYEGGYFIQSNDPFIRHSTTKRFL